MALHLTIIAVGKKGAGPLADLQHLYSERITWPLTIREVEEKRPSPTAAERIQREGNLLLQAIPKGAIVVALDGTGTQFSSEEFAQRLGKWRDTSVSEVIFLIGGADGLAENVRAKAELRHVARRDDLAASSGARHAARTDLSRPDHPRRPPLPPGLICRYPRAYLRNIAAAGCTSTCGSACR